MDLSYILNHLGEERDNYFGAVAPPLIQSSNFAFKTVDELRKSFQQEKDVHLYTRGNNPTVEILRKKLAALAGAEDALVFSSGSAAVAAAILSQVKSGDHVVCVQNPYSWTAKLLKNYLSRFDVTVTMVPGIELSDYTDATTHNTKLWVLESPNTFTFQLQDVKSIATEAKRRGVITMIDNSYCTSLGQRCIEMGIDIEVHSASKYYGGHSDVVAGVLIASKSLTDKIFVTEFQNIGGIVSPHDAWLMLRSLRTLPIRLQRIADSTNKVVEFMELHPKVEKVLYPFSKKFPQFDLAQKQMNWCGGLFSIMLKVDGVQQVEEFCNSLHAFLMAVSWGGHESLIIPACSFYPAEYQGPRTQPYNLIRFYIGLEDVDFLLQDLKQAFEKIE